VIIYPMLALSGLFAPARRPAADVAADRPRAAAHLCGVAARGIWHGDGWSAHLGDVAMLTLMFAACIAVSTRVFRWE
jgi:ABC-2 type transport system permease protein